ncbi:stomatin-like protein 1 isoform X3 [Phyllostomus discolor]|uniref:Stomatin-like protein 1 isoform X3 n=1 Tax=Phyllostomus discolor TaxID=89673 RepID=A0A7E6DYQ6_9CHIR|nr:stomatin-like protein 1 isoform X3 [Phyllostomus discolor]
MVGRSGYRALPLGDLDRFQQSSFGFLGLPKDYLFPEPGSVGPGADAPQTWPSCLCHGLISFLGFLLLLITFPISGWFSLKIVPTYERMIVFRLGRIRTPQGPGMVLLLPFVDSFQRVDLRTRAFSVPPCKLASKDGAVLSVGADVQFRIWDPVLSVMTVKDLNTATRMTAQNAMTKALLKRPLREIQMEKLKISDQLLASTLMSHTRNLSSLICRHTPGQPASPLVLFLQCLSVASCSLQNCALPLVYLFSMVSALCQIHINSVDTLKQYPTWSLCLHPQPLQPSVHTATRESFQQASLFSQLPAKLLLGVLVPQNKSSWRSTM